MKKHSKVGKQPGKPTYRTPSSFKVSQSLRKSKYQAKNKMSRKVHLVNYFLTLI